MARRLGRLELPGASAGHLGQLHDQQEVQRLRQRHDPLLQDLYHLQRKDLRAPLLLGHFQFHVQQEDVQRQQHLSAADMG